MKPGAGAFLAGAPGRPLPYRIWAIAVTASVAGGYFPDPHLFALVVFVLAGLSSAVALGDEDRRLWRMNYALAHALGWRRELSPRHLQVYI